MKKRKFFIIKDDGVYYIRSGWKDKSKWGTKGIGRGNIQVKRGMAYEVQTS